MDVHIATTQFDLQGVLAFDSLDGNAPGTLERRVVAVETMNASAIVPDRGFTDAGRTLTFRFKRPDDASTAVAQRILRLHPAVTISYKEGVFEAAPETLDVSLEDVVFTFIVRSKLSED